MMSFIILQLRNEEFRCLWSQMTLKERVFSEVQRRNMRRYGKLMACAGHYNDPNYSKIQLYFAFIRT